MTRFSQGPSTLQAQVSFPVTCGELSKEVKRQEHETVHWCHYSTAVMNVWRYTYTSPHFFETRWWTNHMDNSTWPFTLSLREWQDNGIHTVHVIIIINKYRTNCKYRTAATLCTLETWFVSGMYVTVNTLHKGDNNNNNNNKCTFLFNYPSRITW
jgi:hypothetical protein